MPPKKSSSATKAPALPYSSPTTTTPLPPLLTPNNTKLTPLAKLSPLTTPNNNKLPPLAIPNNNNNKLPPLATPNNNNKLPPLAALNNNKLPPLAALNKLPPLATPNKLPLSPAKQHFVSPTHHLEENPVSFSKVPIFPTLLSPKKCSSDVITNVQPVVVNSQAPVTAPVTVSLETPVTVSLETAVEAIGDTGETTNQFLGASTVFEEADAQAMLQLKYFSEQGFVLLEASLWHMQDEPDFILLHMCNHYTMHRFYCRQLFSPAAWRILGSVTTPKVLHLVKGPGVELEQPCQELSQALLDVFANTELALGQIVLQDTLGNQHVVERHHPKDLARHRIIVRYKEDNHVFGTAYPLVLLEELVYSPTVQIEMVQRTTKQLEQLVLWKQAREIKELVSVGKTSLKCIETLLHKIIDQLEPFANTHYALSMRLQEGKHMVRCMRIKSFANNRQPDASEDALLQDNILQREFFEQEQFRVSQNIIRPLQEFLSRDTLGSLNAIHQRLILVQQEFERKLRETTLLF